MLFAPEEFFDLDDFQHRGIFDGVTHVWEVLPKIASYIVQVLRPGQEGAVSSGAWVNIDQVYIGPGTVVEPGVMINGPAIIGANCEIRQGAYIRENVIMGDKAILGHASEAKNAIFLNGAHAPHFAYVGDSILGNRINLGAGTKLSNVKITHDTIKVRVGERIIDTGLTKFGAIVGDDTQTGCNSVLNPGTILGKGCLVYPNAAVTGYIPARSVVKLRQEIIITPRRDE